MSEVQPAKFAVGDVVRTWMPGRAEHWLKARVGKVIPYDGPRSVDQWEYQPEYPGWLDEQGAAFWSLGNCVPLAELFLCTESQYRERYGLSRSPRV